MQLPSDAVPCRAATAAAATVSVRERERELFYGYANEAQRATGSYSCGLQDISESYLHDEFDCRFDFIFGYLLYQFYVSKRY